MSEEGGPAIEDGQLFVRDDQLIDSVKLPSSPEDNLRDESFQWEDVKRQDIYKVHNTVILFH